MVSLAGNKRRDLMVQILQEQLKTAGFAMTVKTETPADLFGKIAPQGAYQAGLWSLVDTFPDPTLSASFNSAIVLPGLRSIMSQIASADTKPSS